MITSLQKGPPVIGIIIGKRSEWLSISINIYNVITAPHFKLLKFKVWVLVWVPADTTDWQYNIISNRSYCDRMAQTKVKSWFAVNAKSIILWLLTLWAQPVFTKWYDVPPAVSVMRTIHFLYISVTCYH